jgi:PEGA domain-containing protein
MLAFDAKTAAKVEAKVIETNSGRTVTDGVANDRGTIVLDRVPRGRYRLIVSAPGHRDIVRDVRIDADQTIEIDLGGR